MSTTTSTTTTTTTTTRDRGDRYGPMEMGPTTIACSLYVTVIHVLHVSASSGETPAKYKEPSSSETEIYFITIAAVFGLIAIATCLLCGYLREHEEEPKTKPVERSTSTASSGGPSPNGH